MVDWFPKQAESELTYLVDQKNGDQMIKQLLNSVITKYQDLSVSRRSIICLSLELWLRQIIDLLSTDKSQYFAQPRSIMVKYSSQNSNLLMWGPAFNLLKPEIVFNLSELFSFYQHSLQCRVMYLLIICFRCYCSRLRL